MSEQRKISSYQFFVLIFVFTIGNTIINSPSLVVNHAKQDAWISSIFALLFGLLLVWIYMSLANKFPNMTIIQYTEILLGKTIGKIVSLMLISYFFIIASLTFRQLGDFITTVAIPETPSLTIHILFMFIVLMGAYLGVETLSRTGEFVFPVLLFLLLFLFISLLPEADIQNIKPIFEDGLNPTMKGTISHIGIPYLQLVVFLMLIPFVENSQKARLPFFFGTFLGGIFLVFATLMSILVVGVLLTEFKHYPTYFLAQKISIADIIERLEAIIANTWYITIFFKTSILIYATNLGLSQIFNLKHSRILIIPLGYMLLIITQFITPNVVYFNTFFNDIMPAYTMTFGFFLPMLLLLIALLRKNNLNNEQSKKQVL